MSGRLEKEKRFENMCRNMLDKLPRIANTYYVYFKASNSKRTGSSCYTYVSSLKLYFEYLDTIHVNPDNMEYYKNIRPADITLFIDYYRNNGRKVKTDSSVAVMVNVVKSFYDFLEDNGYISKNPCAKIKPPKVNANTKPVVMTKEEIDKVRDFILYDEQSFYNYDQNEEYWRLRDYLIFTLGCRTGLRCSAIAAIDISDINFDEYYITVVEKGNYKRNVYIGKNTMEIIQTWIRARRYILDGKNIDALFISRKRTRMTNVAINDMIQKYTSQVIPDKHITPHKMRSTCATNLWAETHDIYMVANQLGHHNLSVTKRYTDISESESRKVANILDEL